ncbi:MAG: hypothetical protein L6Q71_09370, partial [Planctomycetes bacterium]|nr:hypothetical protein [Planctomycetota bacterium]
MSRRVVITRAVLEATLSLLRSGLPGVDIVTNPHERNLSRDELLAMVGERCDGLLCSLADPLDAQTIAKFPAKLKVI